MESFLWFLWVHRARGSSEEILSNETICRVKDVHYYRFIFTAGPKPIITTGLGAGSENELRAGVDIPLPRQYFQLLHFHDKSTFK
jgi:hypothetical protein